MVNYLALARASGVRKSTHAAGNVAHLVRVLDREPTPELSTALHAAAVDEIARGSLRGTQSARVLQHTLKKSGASRSLHADVFARVVDSNDDDPSVLAAVFGGGNRAWSLDERVRLAQRLVPMLESASRHPWTLVNASYGFQGGLLPPESMAVFFGALERSFIAQRAFWESGRVAYGEACNSLAFLVKQHWRSAESADAEHPLPVVRAFLDLHPRLGHSVALNARLLRAVGIFRWFPESMRDQLSAAAAITVRSWPSRMSVYGLHAAGRLGLPLPELEEMMPDIARTLPKFNNIEVSKIWQTLLKFPELSMDTETMRRIELDSLARIDTLDGLGVSLLLKLCSRVNYQPAGILLVLDDLLLSTVSEMTHGALSRTIVALAALRPVLSPEVEAALASAFDTLAPSAHDEMLVNMSFNLASLGIMPSAATIGLLHDRTRAAGDEETARRLATAVEALVNKERL